MSYGALNTIDVSLLELVLSQFNYKAMKLLEIGVYSGYTAIGISQYCRVNHIDLEYWGMDNGAICEGKKPFDEAHFIKGDSAESFHLVPNDFDVVFIDGCHCINHVILDTFHYGQKVKPGGFMLFHDTSPELQQTMRDPHGPNIPEFHNSVTAAHRLIKFPFPPWILWRDGWEPKSLIGGTSVYLKQP